MSTSLNTVLVLLIGTVSLTPASCGTNNRSPECEAFLALSANRRVEESRNYSTDKQIDMYLCAVRQEPPDLELAYAIADRGQEAIPVLLARLESTKNEVDQEHLIYVFEVMSDKGHLRGRQDVVAAISNVIDAMKITPVKEDSQESLKKIQVNSGLKPFTYIQ